MINSFEDAVAHLLPACHVDAKFYKKRKGAQIYGIGGGMKGGTGPKTGVELRYYKPTEYKNLSMDEKDELRKLRPESQARNKGITRTRKERVMLRTDEKSKERKSLGNNFKGKVSALKKKQKKDMEEMT